MNPKFYMYCLKIIFILLIIDLNSGIFAQSAGDYRTKANGSWNTISNWETFNGTSWINASSIPNYLNGAIEIRIGDTVTVASALTVDQTTITGMLSVNTGVTLTIADGAGNDLVVTGTISSNGTINVNSGAWWQQSTTTSIPDCNWISGSTLEITGNYDPYGIDDFANLVWNSTANSSVNTSAMNIQAGNTFEIRAGSITFANEITSNLSDTWDGDILVNGGIFNVQAESNSANDPNATLTVNNVTVSSGSLNILYVSNTLGSTPQATLNVNGTLTVNGGTLDLLNRCDLNDVNITATINVKGDFIHSAGIFKRTATASSPASSIYFNGTSIQNIESIGFTYAGSGPVTSMIFQNNTTIPSSKTVYVSNGLSFNGTANDTITVYGNLIHQGTVPNPMNGTGKLKNNGTYIHNTTSSAARMVDFFSVKETNSNWIYRGSSALNTSVSLAGKTFGNLSFESTSGSWTTANFIGTTPLTVNGNFDFGHNVSMTITNTATNIFKGNFNIIGTLTNSTGTQNIQFAGTTEQFFSGSGSFSFENCTVNSGAYLTLSRSLSVSSGFTFNVNGTLSCNTFFVTGSGAFTVSSGGTLKTAHSNGINGSIIVTGTKTFDSGANYEYNGSSYQYTGSLLPSTINNVTINNSSSGVELSSNLNVAGTLTLNQGNVITSSNTLTLGTSTSSLGTLSRNSGTIIGSFARWLNADTVSDVLFPVGTESYYRPAIVSYTTAPSLGGILTVNYFASNPGNNGDSAQINDAGYIINTYSNEGYWQINPTNITGGIYNLNLFADGITGVDNYTALRILKRPNSGSNWMVDGSHSTGTGNNAHPIANRKEMSGFSQFAIGSNLNDNTFTGTLPVELNSFIAYSSGRDVKLIWITSSEMNNDGFILERKLKSSGEWINIAFVKGKGSPNAISEYYYDDKHLNSGLYNYRLKQIDFNGNYKYYHLNNDVEISAPLKHELFQNYPNPFNPITNIEFSLPADSKVLLLIYDASGKLIRTLINEKISRGYHTVFFDASDLSSGVYFCRISAVSEISDFMAVRKMVLLR